MSTFIVEGGHPLHGEVNIKGAKNEALEVICATLLTSETVVIVSMLFYMMCAVVTLVLYARKKRRDSTEN